MNTFGAVYLKVFASHKRLGLALPGFILIVMVYLICLSLIGAVNVIIRLNMYLILAVTWLDRLFCLMCKGIRFSAVKQSSSIRNKNQKLNNIEKEINAYFANLFLLFIPKKFMFSRFIYYILQTHRRIFRIPENFHGIKFLRLFYSNFLGDSKKYSRFNARSFLIYWFILHSHHTCTALIQVLLLTVRESFDFGLWISTQIRSSEENIRLSDYEDAERDQLGCAKRMKENFLSQHMKPNFLPILLAWSPTDAVASDTIVTFLSNFDTDIEIRKQWNQVPGAADSPLAFEGVMANFLSHEKMYKAANALTVSFKHLKCIPAEKLLRFIMHAEASHSGCAFQSCEVIIRGRREITKEEHKQKMKEILSEFGVTNKITFNENFQNSAWDVICTLQYIYLTNAFLAKLYMDRTYISGPFKRNKISIEIKESVYVKETMKQVKRKLIENLEQNQLVDV